MSDTVANVLIGSSYVLGCVCIGLGSDPFLGLGVFLIMLAKRAQEVW